MQATVAYSGYIGMMEKKSETTIIQSLIEYCSIVYYVIFWYCQLARSFGKVSCETSMPFARWAAHCRGA